MSLKAAFAATAVAFLALRDSRKFNTEETDKLTDALAKLNEAEDDYEAFIEADAADAVDKALAGGLGEFSARHSDLHGGHEDRIANLERLANVEREPELTIIPPVSGSPEAGGPAPGLVHADTVVDTVVDAAVGHGGGATFTQGNAGPDAVTVEAPEDSGTEPVSEVTDEATQGDSALAAETADDLVPGAATGPDEAGVVRNEGGYVADAPDGSMDAAFAGVQRDNTTGEVVSTGTDPAPAPVTAETVDEVEEAHHEAAVEGADGGEPITVVDTVVEPEPEAEKTETAAEKKARLKTEAAEDLEDF